MDPLPFEVFGSSSIHGGLFLPDDLLLFEFFEELLSVARLELPAQLIFIVEDRTAVLFILEEIVVVVALVAHLLVEWYVQADNLLAAVGYLRFQLYSILVLYVLELSESLASLLEDLLLGLPHDVFDFLFLLALALVNVIEETALEGHAENVRLLFN